MTEDLILETVRFLQQHPPAEVGTVPSPGGLHFLAVDRVGYLCDDKTAPQTYTIEDLAEISHHLGYPLVDKGYR